MQYIPLIDNDALGATVLLHVRHAIETAGHVCVFSERSLMQMKGNRQRISRCVKAVDADAWIVCIGSRVVLEWFAAQSFPVFAYGGRFQNLPLASTATSIAPAIESAVKALVNLGHRRIVMLIGEMLRLPTRIPLLDHCLAVLKAHGIVVTDYNLPTFDGSAESLESCLDGLFRLTPPTALLVHQTPRCVAVLGILVRRGLRVPHDVSVICMTSDPAFSHYLPPLDHCLFPSEKFITSISRWLTGVAKGRPDKCRLIIDSEYVPGGTIGPAKI